MTAPTIIYPQQATVVQQDGRPFEQNRYYFHSFMVQTLKHTLTSKIPHSGLTVPGVGWPGTHLEDPSRQSVGKNVFDTMSSARACTLIILVSSANSSSQERTLSSSFELLADVQL